MAEHSAIEWTDATWNPITGCSVVSPGCTNCYAMRLAGTRLAQHPSRAGLTRPSKAGPVWNGQVRFNEDWLTQPLTWRRPRMIFVCAHGDLFHENVPDEWIDRVFAVMALCPQHTFQVLTKRAERMRAYVSDARERVGFSSFINALRGVGRVPAETLRSIESRPWPLPNVWLGVSAEDQQRADERVPHLLATPAAVRFVSAEPLLGPIDFWNGDPDPRLGGHKATATYLGDWWEPGDNPKGPSRHGVDWIIVGGESQDGARPMHPDWARSIRDQCAAAEVPFFFKQWGEWLFEDQIRDGQHPGPRFFSADDGSPIDERPPFGPATGRLWHWWQPRLHASVRIGKKAAGRLLDGAEHNGMPEVRR